MIYGYVLLAVAALVVVAAVVCWLAGVQLVALVKIALTACAVLLTVAGVIVVSGDLLLSAGYFGSGRGEPNKQTTVIPPDTDYFPVAQRSGTEQETQHWLHEETVRVFTESQGFGMGRMPLPRVDDIIAKPKSPSLDDPKGTSPTVRAGDPKQPLRGHVGVEKAIVGCTFFSPPPAEPTEVWTVRKVQLVGLIQHPEPVVYLTDKLPNMKEPKDVPTRELGAFEKTALAALRGGEDLKSEKNGKEMRLMGPIYAGSRCVSCHDKGQMLGAFTYQLELVPVAGQEVKGTALTSNHERTAPANAQNCLRSAALTASAARSRSECWRFPSTECGVEDSITPFAAPFAFRLAVG